MMENRKLQLYVTEHQYQLLKRRAGAHGSIAAVVREMIDRSVVPSDADADAFVKHVEAAKEGSGRPYSAEEAKNDLYKRTM